MYTCNIIGAGRLGKNIAYALLSSGRVRLQGIYNRDRNSANETVRLLGAGQAVTGLEDLPSATLTCITTQDAIIPTVVAEFAKIKILPAGSTVVHCSGVLPSTLLAPLRDQGCMIASFHPLRAFRTGMLSKEAFHGCDCVTEGDAEAISLLKEMFTPLGARFVNIRSDKKASYHAAAVIASNYLVTLAATAQQLFQEAGMDVATASQCVIQLMQSSFDNIQRAANFAKALTGPLERGDSATLEMHLEALHCPEYYGLYKAAALATLPLTNLADEDKQRILQSLGNQRP